MNKDNKANMIISCVLSSYFSYKPVKEAQNEVLKFAEKIIKHVYINTSNSIGYVLAKDVMSEKDIPPYDVAHFDGYAIRSQDTQNASHNTPCRLKVVGEMGLLDSPEKFSLSEGEAVKIVTGSPLPKGSDAVAPKEQVKIEDGFITLIRPIPSGYHVIPKGSDIRKGELVLRYGTKISGKELKVLMDLGIDKVEVFKKPKVYIMPIGSELVEGEKRETHSHLLSYLIKINGGEPVITPPIRDEPDVIGATMRSLIEKSDILVTIGGLSVGPKDYTWSQAIKMEGTRIRGLRVHPGKVTSAVLSKKPVIMLPGLIQSTLSGAVFLLLPLIRKVSGLSPSPLYLKYEAKVKNDVELPTYKPFKKFRLVRGSEKGIEVLRYESIQEGVLLKADGAIIVKEHVERLKKGEKVKVWGVEGLF